MWQTIRNSFASPAVRKKMIYTIILLIISRFGSYVFVPFIKQGAMATLMKNSGASSLFAIMDVFSGGAFANATIFAMSITPYVNASIIMMLLTNAITPLEKLSKEGEAGQKKIAQYTRILTVGLAFLQATAFYFMLAKGQNTNGTPLIDTGWVQYIVIALSFTAGTAFLMWLGEQITEKGIGNGITLIICAGIVAGLPKTFTALFNAFSASGGNGTAFVYTLLVLAGILAAVVAVVFMNDSERRMQIQYAKRVVGRKMYGGQSNNLPIKLLASGVMPIIYAMSILSFPQVICSFFGITNSTPGFWGTFLKLFSSGSWIYAIIYFVLVILFTFFATFMQYQPTQMANQIKQNGGYLPGIMPGRPTANFIKRVVSRVTVAGAIFMAFLAVLPILVSIIFHIQIGLGGTSILIVVGSALDISRQLESNLITHNYKGFLG